MVTRQRAIDCRVHTRSTLPGESSASSLADNSGLARL